MIIPWLQKEEKIALVLLLMTIASLSVAYWAFGVETVNSDREAAARITTVDGIVTKMRETKSGGHLILELDSTAMPVFVPSDRGASSLLGRLQVGDRVRVRGTVEEFEGTNEISVSVSGGVELI